MSTSFATIALTNINPHPANPRRHAVADDELVDSIKAMGVLTPVAVAPAGDHYVLIGGHRRFDGANKAGLDDIPAVIREDLNTEAAQLEAMLVENLHRVDLTPVEEADAYEQLALFGMKPAEIAKATGRKASTVKARLKLKALPEKTRGRLHDGQITLGDAEALLEFADDSDTLAKLEKAIGTGNFAYQVQWARDARKRERAIAEGRTQAEELGAVEAEWGHGVRSLDTFHDEALRKPAAHDGCLGYRVGYSVTDDESVPWWKRNSHALHGYVDKVTDTHGEGHVAFVRWFAVAIDNLLTWDSGLPKRQLALWNWLESTGHDMSEVDVELRDACEARLAAEQEQEQAS